MSLHSVPRSIQTSTKRVLSGGDITVVTPTTFQPVPGTRFKVFVQKNSLVELMAEFTAGGTAAGNQGFDFRITSPAGVVTRLGQGLGLKAHVIVAGTVGARLPMSLNAVLSDLPEGEHTIEFVVIDSAGNAVILADAATSPLEITVRQSVLIYPVPGIDT